MKQSMGKKDAEPIPPGTEPVFNIACKDVVMGRGSGTQNHCGNVTYRKLVYLNKELYATSSKFDKLKISKAIVAAVRKFGGRFLQADGNNGHLDIGDKRAWDKTSQALREGQTEIRAKLAADEENASGAQKVAEYKQVITEQTFLAYAFKILESLYDPASGSMTSCGPNCPHARRRATMNRTDAMVLQHAPCKQQQQGNVFINQQQLQNQQYMQDPRCQYNMAFPQNYAIVNNCDYNHAESMPPLPEMGLLSSGNDASLLEPLPYNLPYSNQPQAMQQSQCAFASSATSIDTWEVYPEGRGNRDTISSFDTAMNSYDTDTLRILLSDDAVDMESNEMSRQLSDMIRRKSQGLIRIDAVEAFEDLVFEEDSADGVKFPEPRVSNASDKSFSGLSNRCESLMNMTLLTIDDKEGASEASVKRISRVSFKPENVSAMSLDIGSIRDIDESVDSFEKESNDGWKTSTDSSPVRRIKSSRAMGFPIRKTVMNRFNAGIPTVIPSNNEDTRNGRDVSTLTFSEASELQKDVDFDEMTKKIEPPSSELSLSANMSLSNMSLMSAVGDNILGEDKKVVNQV